MLAANSSPKSSPGPGRSVPGPQLGENICMVDCAREEGCTCTRARAAPGPGPGPGPRTTNQAEPQTHGFDNLAYERGSQSELRPPTPPSSSATFRLPGLGPEPGAEAIGSRISGLAGVLSVCCPSRRLLRVDYDASLITERDLVLEVQNTGLDVESVVWIRVEGLRCQPCVQTVQEQLGSLSGVSSIRGSLQERALMVTYRPLLVTQQELKQHIWDLGFSSWSLAEAELSRWQEVSPDWSAQTVTLCVAGMTCSSCSSSIQERISQVGGVRSVAVSLRDGTATVTFDPRLTEAELLRAAVQEMGFEASLPESALTGSSGRLSPQGTAGTAGTSWDSGVGPEAPRGAAARSSRCVVGVTGMTCASCVGTIERQLRSHAGVAAAFVSLMAGKAEVTYDPDVLGASDVARLIEDLGFSAALVEAGAAAAGTLDLRLSGLSCASCVHKIESKLGSTRGVVTASVSLATNSARVRYDPGAVGARELLAIIQDLGFQAELEKTGLKHNLDHSQEIQQ